MNKRIIYFLCFFVLLVMACSETVSDNVDQAYLAQADELKSTIPFLIIDKDNFDNIEINRKNGITKGDFFEFNSAKRNGDQLELSVSYSGGCELHYLSVIWDGIIYTDDPCHMNIIITHNANRDKCEAYITKTFNINLKNLIGDIEYKDICEYRLFNTFNSSEEPDLKFNN